MKKIIVLFVGLFLVMTAMAQDKIYKKNGEIIEAKVYSISSDFITFKQFNNLEGPEYNISKAEVAKIVYATGTTDIFAENNDRIGVKNGNTGYGYRKNNLMNKNTISFSPIQFTENGYGFGLSYERILDDNGWVSFYLPVMYTFNSQTNTNYYNTNNTSTNSFNNPMFYLMPGIKVYTNINSTTRTKHSIGVSLVLGVGNGVYQNNALYNTDPTYTQNRFLFGSILNYGANLFVTPHLYMGADIGMGIAYVNEYDGVNKGVGFLFDMSGRVGYRFSGKKRRH